MGQVITIEGSIPEDLPENIREPEAEEAAKQVVRKRLALRPQDEVIIKIREKPAEAGETKSSTRNYMKTQPCKHREYCAGDCSECEGTAGEANLWIARGRGRL